MPPAGPGELLAPLARKCRAGVYFPIWASWGYNRAGWRAVGSGSGGASKGTWHRGRSKPRAPPTIGVFLGLSFTESANFRPRAKWGSLLPRTPQTRHPSSRTLPGGGRVPGSLKAGSCFHKEHTGAGCTGQGGETAHPEATLPGSPTRAEPRPSTTLHATAWQPGPGERLVLGTQVAHGPGMRADGWRLLLALSTG